MKGIETRIVGKVTYTKRPAPYNWKAEDEIGLIAVGETKRECQHMVAELRKKFGSKRVNL